MRQCFELRHARRRVVERAVAVLPDDRFAGRCIRRELLRRDILFPELNFLWLRRALKSGEV